MGEIIKLLLFIKSTINNVAKSLTVAIGIEPTRKRSRLLWLIELAYHRHSRIDIEKVQEVIFVYPSGQDDGSPIPRTLRPHAKSL